jgi:hypothetical protein
MNTETLWPALIALQLTVAALIVGAVGREFEEQESGRHNPAWQGVKWNPGPDCVAWHAGGELARYWPGARRQLNAMGSDRRSCVNIH